MSFLFRKNGSSSRKRIKEKIRSRISDRGKREEERPRYDGSDSRPQPPSPWGFLFPDDFVRIDGNLKAVIVDEEGLDVIYWRKLLELENSRKIRNPRPRKSGERGGDESGGGFRRSGTAESNEDEDSYGGSGDYRGDSQIEEAFSFHVKKTQSPLSSGGESRDQSVDGARYSGYSTSSASPSRASTSGVGDYGAVGKPPQSKFQAPVGSFPSSSPRHSLSQSSGGRSPQLPLPPGQFMAAAGSSSRPSSPFPANQTSPHPPSYAGGSSPSSYAGGPSPPSYAGGASPPSYPGGSSPSSYAAGPSPPSYPGGSSPSSYAGGPSPPSYPGGSSPSSYAAGPSPPSYPGGPSPPQSVGGSLPPPPSAGAPPPPPPLAGAPPPPPPPIPAKGPAPPPPPPPGKKPAAPPPPPMSKTGPPKAPGPPKGPTKSGETSSAIGKSGNPAQPKFKPLHWDKVNPDASRSTVWNRIDGGSFSFDDDNLMEALFGYVGAKKSPTEANSVSRKPIVSTTQTYILDPRKSQNTAIVLRSLGMTKEELIDLLTEGHDADADTLEKLAGLAPTPEEQSQIIDYNDDPTKLAYAETLLFHILKAVPSAFNRFNVMLFKINYASEVTHQKVSLQTLESACNELRARGLFMKLLEAILKAGNRMNAGTARGNAQAFNLTALRKLSDVKSVDGKTTLLHFVVEEVVRSEGKRAAMKNVSSNDEITEITESNPENAEGSREEQEKEFVKLGLPVVGGLSSEFTSVKKAASIDYESFVGTTLALGTRLKETKRLLDQSQGKEDGCLTKLRSFFESAEEELKVMVEDQNRIIELVKRTTNYYQAGALKERNLFMLFVIIRDFLGMVDNACNEIARNQRKQRPVASGAGTGTGASASASTSTTTAAGAAPSAAPQRNAVRFPILPPNFMSESSRYSSSDSDSDS